MISFNEQTHGSIAGILQNFDTKRLLYRRADDYFPAFVKELLTEIWEELKKQLLREGLDFEATLLELLSKSYWKLADGLYQTLEYYYAGNVLSATQHFNNTLEGVDFLDKNKTFDIFQDDTFNQGNIQTNGFYRARLSKTSRLEKKELFHPPFEGRHLNKTQRFSIPGFPVLYLAGSVYACWEEYDRPSLAEFHVAKFQSVRPVSLIRLLRPFQASRLVTSLGAEDAGRYEEDGVRKVNPANDRRAQIVFNYLTTFPLVIVCLLRTQHSEAVFKPEYIIPQLLLQYISGSVGVDGIMYPSTKIEYFSPRGENQLPVLTRVDSYNYVFPVKSVQPTGYCKELVDLFKMSEPVSFDVEQIQEFDQVDVKGSICLVRGKSTEYKRTRLGRMEAYLNTLPLSNLAR